MENKNQTKPNPTFERLFPNCKTFLFLSRLFSFFLKKPRLPDYSLPIFSLHNLSKILKTQEKNSPRITVVGLFIASRLKPTDIHQRPRSLLERQLTFLESVRSLDLQKSFCAIAWRVRGGKEMKKFFGALQSDLFRIVDRLAVKVGMAIFF